MSVRVQSSSTSEVGTWSAMPKVRSKSEKRSPPSTASEPTAAPATTRSSRSATRSTCSRRASRCSTVNTSRDSSARRASPSGSGRLSNFGCDTVFDQLGFGTTILGPGQPLSMYHWESDQEDFLLLSGTATLIVEGHERPLRQWDFVHCPPYAEHTIVGGPCVVLGVGSRERHTEIGPDGRRRGGADGGVYPVDETAIR